jgi:hypothetical protein
MNSSKSFKYVVFVFNGDADGIISQHIAGLSGLRPDLRITGLKRDIRLLERVPPREGLDITVFDINLDTNRAALETLLALPDATLSWYDHHEPGIIPDSPRLKTRILNTRGVCSALLAHAAFPGADPRWAAMAAFGDNLPEAARALLAPLALPESEIEALREAGELINYNSHGETPADVLFQPLEVAERMAAFREAGGFLRESGFVEPLRAQLSADRIAMGALAPEAERGRARFYRLPAEAWARRLGSTHASGLALAHPDRAFAFAHPLRDGAYQVSIRAPRGDGGAAPASALALEFPTGGGRALAAGINRLPRDEVDAFVRRFFEIYG